MFYFVTDQPSIWKTAANTTPCSWWKGTSGWTQLSKIAAIILSLPPTSAAVERSFSRHAWIHSARRNRLTTDRAAELIFIAHNFALCNNNVLEHGRKADETDSTVMVATARPTVEQKKWIRGQRCRYRKWGINKSISTWFLAYFLFCFFVEIFCLNIFYFITHCLTNPYTLYCLFQYKLKHTIIDLLGIGYNWYSSIISKNYNWILKRKNTK